MTTEEPVVFVPFSARFLIIFLGTCLLFFWGGGTSFARDLLLWTINPGTPFGRLTDVVADDFSKKYQDVHVASIHFSNNLYKIQVPAGLQSENAPDVFHSWGGKFLADCIAKQQVVPLDDLEKDLKSIYLPVAFQPVTDNGRIYGVPYSGLAGVFFWYRKDVFQKLGLHPPSTWEEFLEVGEQLKRNGIIPIALANKNKWPGSFFYMYLVDRIGGPSLFGDVIGQKNGRLFTDPSFIEAGRMVQDLVRRDFFPTGFNRAEDEPGNWNSLIISGKAGMYLMGSWFLSALKKLPPEHINQFDFFPFPTVEGGKGDAADLIGSPGQDYLSIFAKKGEQQEAKRFLIEAISNEQYFEEIAKQGFVPPVKNYAKYINDPLSLKVAKSFHRARHVQLYYDQVLPMEMAEAHKMLIHQLFELRVSPEEVAQKHEQLFRNEKQQ